MGNTSSSRLGDAFQASHNVSTPVEASATTPRAWLHNVGARNALVHAADQGNLALLKLICDSSEGRTFHGVNDGASKSQAPLMRACTHGSTRHTECVAYLLAHGADVYAQNSRGDNAMHIAAKNGNAGALHALLSFRPHADGEDGSQLLGDIVVQGDAGPTRFIDLHNGSGVTALHLAALKGSHTAVRELLRSGAAADAVTLSGIHNPQLSRGSTALHIAASRGHAGVVTALLEHQTGIPGMELQRLRNARGLKPSQLARLAGHHSVARLLSEVNISSGPQPYASGAAAASSSVAAAELPRRAGRAALPARQDPGRLPAGSPERGGMSQEALLAALTQRARLLLSLRATTLDPDRNQEEPSGDSSEEAALVAVSAEVAVALRSKGAGSASAEPSSTLLGLLSTLAEPSSAATAQHSSSNGPLASASRRSSADKAADESATSEESQMRQQTKTAKSFAAGALVQAALNAMAVVSPGKEIPISSGFLAPASPLAAVIAVQAALKKLANQRIGSRLLTVHAGQVPIARTGAAMGAVPGMHRAVSGVSLRSSASTAGVSSGSNARGRRRRRMNAVRLGLSGSHVRHEAGLEIPDSASVASHVASRRRRHRRNGSFGSMGYPAALPAHPSHQHTASRGALAAATALNERDAPESSAASRSHPGSSLDPAELGPVQAEPPREADVVQADAMVQPARHDSSRASLERGDRPHPRDSTATELPEEWVTALHSLDSSKATSQPVSGTSEACTVGTGSGIGPASALQARPCEGKGSLLCSPHDLRHRAEDASDLLDEELEPMLPSSVRTIRASSSRNADPYLPADKSCSQLQVRSRLFSTSEDAPLGINPQVLTSSPTNPFDTAEILGSDSIPSSPFGDSTADEWLHVPRGLESGSADHAWPAEELLVRGSLLPGSDLGYTHTEDSESIESRDLQWQTQDRTGLQAIYDTIPIDGIVPHQESPLLGTFHPVPDHSLLEANEDFQTTRMSSVPLPGTAAAQVAEAFGRRTTFQRPPPSQPEPCAILGRAYSGSLPSTSRLPSSSSAGPSSTHESLHSSHTRSRATGPTACPGQLSELASEKQDTFLEGQMFVAPTPGAAAAEVRRAFAKITSSSGSSSAGNVPSISGSVAPDCRGAKTGTPGHVQQPGSPASPAFVSLEPGVLREQEPTAAADSATALSKAESEAAASAAQENEKPPRQGMSDQDHCSDQHESALPTILSKVQSNGKLVSSVRDPPMQEQPALGRAMSLKGAAAADTARAFSRLRRRAGTSAATTHTPSPPASRPTSLDGKSATKAALPEIAGPGVGSTGRASEPGSSFVMDLWGQQSESSTVRLEEYRLAEEPVLDLFPECPARQWGRPVNAAGRSLSEASSHTAAAVPPSSQRETGISEDPEALDSPGISVPQSAFEHDTIEGADVSMEARGVQQTPRQPSGSEAKSQVRLPHSRADLKVVSPRKRASLGRRLSGLLPGVKGKERMRVAAATREMCFICMDAALEVSISTCQHSLCRQCAYQLCARGLAPPLCPFCRGTIQRFEAMPRPQPALTAAI